MSKKKETYDSKAKQSGDGLFMRDNIILKHPNYNVWSGEFKLYNQTLLAELLSTEGPEGERDTEN